jgi:hypothetical protein
VGHAVLLAWYCYLRRGDVPLLWPGAPGRVVAAHAAAHKEEDETEYEPVVEYAYHAKGRDYTARTFWIAAPRYDDRRAAEEEARRHPPGTAVTVYYEPGRPENAYVINDTGANPAIFNAVVILFTLLSAPATNLDWVLVAVALLVNGYALAMLAWMWMGLRPWWERE